PRRGGAFAVRSHRVREAARARVAVARRVVRLHGEVRVDRGVGLALEERGLVIRHDARPDVREQREARVALGPEAAAARVAGRPPRRGGAPGDVLGALAEAVVTGQQVVDRHALRVVVLEVAGRAGDADARRGTGARNRVAIDRGLAIRG